MNYAPHDTPNYSPNYSSEFIFDLVRQHGSPLMLVDCDGIRHQYALLQRALPNVDLHYALKPLPHPSVVRTIRAMGGYFDLATSGEVALAKQCGVDPERTIHTHPIKRAEDIECALNYGTRVFVVDSRHELAKFRKYRDRAQVLIRLSFPNPNVFSDLSRKFGCRPEKALSIAKLAAKYRIRVVGLSFHVGSQTLDASQFVYAIEQSIKVIQQVADAGLGQLSVLDIGGGFPVVQEGAASEIVTFCQPIRAALAKVPKGVRLIAEPGRFIVASAVTNVCSVIGKAHRNGQPWYYLDDGLYGSFSGIMFDHGQYQPRALRISDDIRASVLAGPTCDSIDVIADPILLPKLQDGDLLVTSMIGAYSAATATDFNFFPRAKLLALNEADASVHRTTDFQQTA